MINNLPEDWKIKELGNCVDILDKQRIPLNNQEREERIKNKDISELYPYYGATQQTGYIDDFIFNEELVLLGEDGVMFYDRDKPKAYLINGKSWVNNHAHVLRAKKNITINKYLLNFLNTFHYKGFVSGATRLKLNQSRMAKIPIPVAPLKQQEKIVKVLDLTSNLIEKQKELLEKYGIFLKSKFIEMFGNIKDNPNNFDIEPIKNFGRIITGNTPSRKEEEFYNDNFIEWIKTGNIHTNQQYVSTASEYLSEKGMKKGRTLEKGGLLITCIAGSLKSIGNVAMTDRKITFNQQINAIQPFDKVEPLFLYWQIKINKNYIQTFSTSSMKKIITKGEFQEIEFLKPPFELQKKFSQIAFKMSSIIEKEKKKLKYLEDLHNSLMQKAFIGEI